MLLAFLLHSAAIATRLLLTLTLLLSLLTPLQLLLLLLRLLLLMFFLPALPLAAPPLAQLVVLTFALQWQVLVLLPASLVSSLLLRQRLHSLPFPRLWLLGFPHLSLLLLPSACSRAAAPVAAAKQLKRTTAGIPLSGENGETGLIALLLQGGSLLLLLLLLLLLMSPMSPSKQYQRPWAGATSRAGPRSHS